jgi:hypothetical protein
MNPFFDNACYLAQVFAGLLQLRRPRTFLEVRISCKDSLCFSAFPASKHRYCTARAERLLSSVNLNLYGILPQATSSQRGCVSGTW